MILAKPKTSVIIATYFTGPTLWKCLDACIEQADEVIIVSNGNRVETLVKLDQIAQQNPSVRLFKGGGNIGFARASNFGAKQARSEILMFLNPDAILHAGTLQTMRKILLEQTSPCLVGARLLNKDGSEQRGARRGKMTPWSALVSLSGLRLFEKISPLFADMHWERQPLPDQPIEVPAVSGAGMMFRKTDFETVGRFDRRYFLHVEDLDICRTMTDLGGKVIFSPKAVITHYGSTSRAGVFFVNWQKAKGLVQYFIKFSTTKRGFVGAVLLAPLIVSAIMLRTFWLKFRR